MTVEAVKFFTAPALGRFATHGQESVEAQNSYHRALDLRHLCYQAWQLAWTDHSLIPLFVPGQDYDRTVPARVWRIEEKITS